MKEKLLQRFFSLRMTEVETTFHIILQPKAVYHILSMISGKWQAIVQLNQIFCVIKIFLVGLAGKQSCHCYDNQGS